ncbi:MAG TPA: hypothetical protein VHR72_06025 [Gemmataceae bacterium]|jgi:REP element-mobilizing transposase RayT|nr:hypothetical protein [Gemmataceae bacterium]
MSIAISTTWTAYGTWLPGDPRLWNERGRGVRLPDRLREFQAALRMTESAVLLDQVQRELVDKTIVDHCKIRKWLLHAVTCRSNHVHVSVTAPVLEIEIPRKQFKAWCTRKLNELELSRNRAAREDWWTQRGWDEHVDDERELSDVNAYILEGQDGARFDGGR